MNVLIAGTSGFCHGVRRAMRIALEAAREHGGLYADGPLVHNRQAVELLALHGVSPDAVGKPVLIRAHGIAPGEKAAWLAGGGTLVNATCPRVAANQSLVEQSNGDVVVLFAGDREHAESRAVLGCASGRCVVIDTPEEALAFAPETPVFLMAQTTFSVERFKAIADAVGSHFVNPRIIDTICRATHDRQEETARLARRADALVVVGGRHSANTQRLAEVGRAAGIPVHCIETADELREEDFSGLRTVAVTSGASTPGWITQDAVNRLRGMGRRTFASTLYRLLFPLVETRASTLGAAAGYGLAATGIVSGRPDWLLALAGACFVFFAHTVNRRIPPNPEARRLSLIDAYYQSRRWIFVLAAALAAAASLAAGFAGGGLWVAVFFLVLFVAALAFKRSHFSRYLPMSAGWALALAGPVGWLSGWRVGGLLFGGVVFLVCFAGTLLRDLHDSASDHLMGIDTLAARHGSEYAGALAGWLYGSSIVPLGVLGVLAPTFPARSVAFFLILVPVAGILLLGRIRRKHIHDSILAQAGVDGLGWLSGCIALAAAWWFR